jgi:hypothetical protein
MEMGLPMNARLRTVFTSITVCSLLLATTGAESALGSSHPKSVFLTNDSSKIVGISLGLVAVGAGVGLGIYFAVHHGHTLTGCAASTPDGVELVTEGDRQTYSLIGDVAGIKAGDRVRVSGKKKKDGGSSRRFLVEKPAKDFGACKALPATP